MVSDCRLVKGSAAIAAQITLASLILLSLLYKRFSCFEILDRRVLCLRQRERPKRPFLIWFMDVSKQGFSATTCHIINVTFALLAGHSVSGQASECAWYFVQYNVDNVFGVPLTMLVHSLVITTAASWMERRKTKDGHQGQWSFVEIISSCGNYGNPPKVLWWGVQVFEWISSVVVARSISGCLMVVLADVVLKNVGIFIDSLFHSVPVLQLYFVIVIYPMVVSMCVAWLLDGLLKTSKRSTNVEEELREHFIDVEQ